MCASHHQRRLNVAPQHTRKRPSLRRHGDGKPWRGQRGLNTAALWVHHIVTRETLHHSAVPRDPPLDVCPPGPTLEDRHPWPGTFLPALETKYRLLYTLSDNSIQNEPNIDAGEPATCSCCSEILVLLSLCPDQRDDVKRVKNGLLREAVQTREV